jgi:hypothetical protein
VNQVRSLPLEQPQGNAESERERERGHLHNYKERTFTQLQSTLESRLFEVFQGVLRPLCVYSTTLLPALRTPLSSPA